jgi:putative DNA methylase
VQWENTTNEKVLQAARDEIRASWRRACAENAGHPRAKELFDRHRLPAFHDPFAGGGASAVTSTFGYRWPIRFSASSRIHWP